MELIPYEGSFDYPEGLELILRGKPVEEQLTYFWVQMLNGSNMLPSAYFAADYRSKFDFRTLRHLLERETEQILMQDGLVVGLRLPQSGKNILPYRTICSDTCSDNNGAGYKSTTYNETLVILPPDPQRPPQTAPPFSFTPDRCKVPVSEYQGERIELADEVLTQLRGKSVGEQLDYFTLYSCDKPYQTRRSTYIYIGTELSTTTFGGPLRYLTDRLREIYVQDGIIVAVRRSIRRRGSDTWEDHVFRACILDQGFDYSLVPLLYI